MRVAAVFAPFSIPECIKKIYNQWISNEAYVKHQLTGLMIIQWLFSEIDECASNPCRNGGVCLNQVDFYLCACVAGWTGTNCEISKQLLICLWNIVKI